jgi:hypothetical protein
MAVSCVKRTTPTKKERLSPLLLHEVLDVLGSGGEFLILVLMIPGDSGNEDCDLARIARAEQAVGKALGVKADAVGRWLNCRREPTVVD